jgi:hypothetical protein
MQIQDKGIDFIAYDAAGRVVLIAQAKSRYGMSEEWATRFRRNMLSHGGLPEALFFLIATPERMYFWKQDQDAANAPPAFTIDAGKEFGHYLDKLNTPPRAVGEQSLELLVLSWLTDLARTGEARVEQDPSMAWLAESGLIDSLETAHIELNPA